MMIYMVTVVYILWIFPFKPAVSYPLRAVEEKEGLTGHRNLFAGPSQVLRNVASYLIPEWSTMPPPLPPPPPNNGERQAQPGIQSEEASLRRSCGECCGYGSIESGDAYEKLDPWYTKVLNYKGTGFLIASGEKTADAALYQAALELDMQSKLRPDLIPTMVQDDVHYAIMSETEFIYDIPEFKDIDPSFYITRGQGAWRRYSDCVQFPHACDEAVLLCLPSSIFFDDNICIHENTHSLTGESQPTPRYLVPGDPSSGTINEAVEAQYQKSVVQGGLWNNTYAAVNSREYFAQATNAYYYEMTSDAPPEGNGILNDINTREELKAYDPELVDLLEKVFPSDVLEFPCPTNVACDCSTFVCPTPATVSNDIPAYPGCPSCCNALWKRVKSWAAPLGRMFTRD